MQTEAPDVFDIRKETEATLKLYGMVERLAYVVDAIVEDFLSFARLRATELASTDLNELMTDIAALLYHSRRFCPGTRILFAEQPEQRGGLNHIHKST